MMNRHWLVAALSLVSAGVFAQTGAESTVQRDVNQQTRIENGLKDGSLNVREAGRLEREESRVDRIQAHELRDGKLTEAERARLNAAQNKVSADIAAERHNAVTGNPNSRASTRLQGEVSRNVNQEKRIEAGIQSGALTNREASKLERGQARIDHREARAAADGHIGKREQAGIERSQDHQSSRIYSQKHDRQRRG
jgi:hypothetical protein